MVCQLTNDHFQAVAKLETQLFNSRFNADDLRMMYFKSGFYGSVIPAADRPVAIISYCLSLITPDHTDILAIGTEKSSQGRGFGRLILQHVIAVSSQRQVKKISLEVAADNLHAIKLYKSSGFSESALRKNYYRRGHDRCDGLVMVRMLDTAFT